MTGLFRVFLTCVYFISVNLQGMNSTNKSLKFVKYTIDYKSMIRIKFRVYLIRDNKYLLKESVT